MEVLEWFVGTVAVILVTIVVVVIPSVLNEITKRLVTTLDAGGKSVEANLTDVSEQLRVLAALLEGKDKKSAASLLEVLQADPHTPVFVGKPRGSHDKVLVTSDRVHSAPILDPDGRTIGVNFPSNPRDHYLPARWSRSGLDRVRDQYYVKENRRMLPGDFVGRNKYPRLPAPWADKAKTEAMLFSRAHATADVYVTEVDTGRTMLPIHVDGSTFGRVLSANEHFRTALRNEPKSLLIQMSCKPASGPAAGESAAALHKAGIHLDVYAAAETAYTRFRQTDLPIYNDLGVAPGTTGSGDQQHWKVFKAPRGGSSPPPE